MHIAGGNLIVVFFAGGNLIVVFFAGGNLIVVFFAGGNLIVVLLQAAIWEMEERQLHERHQLAKRQLKEQIPT